MNELQRRRNTLLGGSKLNAEIAKMIRKLDLPATCHSITSITGRDGRGEIVIELFIDVKDTANIARVYVYLTEDLFGDKAFGFIDSQLGTKGKKIDIDTRITLRALRVVFNIIKNVNNRWANSVDYTKIVYVRTAKNGTCEYNN